MTMLNTTGIDHLNLRVKDLSETIDFWQALMGFEVLEDMPEYTGAIIGNGRAKLAIYQYPTLKVDRTAGFSHVCFHIENFDDILSTCDKLGIEILYDGVVDWPHSRSVYIHDPNGYEIELSEVWGGGL